MISEHLELKPTHFHSLNFCYYNPWLNVSFFVFIVLPFYSYLHFWQLSLSAEYCYHFFILILSQAAYIITLCFRTQNSTLSSTNWLFTPACFTSFLCIWPYFLPACSLGLRICQIFLACVLFLHPEEVINIFPSTLPRISVTMTSMTVFFSGVNSTVSHFQISLF